MIPLTAEQRATLRAATPDGHAWRVNTRSQGWRGLTSRGLAYGYKDANRAPGTLGLLTPAGIAARDEIFRLEAENPTNR